MGVQKEKHFQVPDESITPKALYLYRHLITRPILISFLNDGRVGLTVINYTVEKKTLEHSFHSTLSYTYISYVKLFPRYRSMK